MLDAHTTWGPRRAQGRASLAARALVLLAAAASSAAATSLPAQAQPISQAQAPARVQDHAAAARVPLAATASHTFQVTGTGGLGVCRRTAPRLAATRDGCIAEGRSVQVTCWVVGETVTDTWGGRRISWNRWARTPDARFIADIYLNSGRDSYPQCAGAPSTPPPPAPTPGPGDHPAIWVGSPVDGAWAHFDESLPRHHGLFYGGDWSVDLAGTGVGQGVHLYAAPRNGGTVTAKVESVGPACGSRRLGDGGHVVRIGLYSGGTRVGVASYSHVEPSVSAGQTISRWGGKIGEVGTYRYGSDNRCWEGAHVHFELYSERRYACFNKGYKRGARLEKSNFLGFVGGNFASGRRQACP